MSDPTDDAVETATRAVVHFKDGAWWWTAYAGDDWSEDGGPFETHVAGREAATERFADVAIPVVVDLASGLEAPE